MKAFIKRDLLEFEPVSKDELELLPRLKESIRDSERRIQELEQKRKELSGWVDWARKNLEEEKERVDKLKEENPNTQWGPEHITYPIQQAEQALRDRDSNLKKFDEDYSHIDQMRTSLERQKERVEEIEAKLKEYVVIEVETL